MKIKENDLQSLPIRLEINFHKLTQSKQAQVTIKKVRKSLFIQGGTRLSCACWIKRNLNKMKRI